MWHRMRQGLSKVAVEDTGAKITGWVKVTRCPGEQQAPQWQRLCVGGREGNAAALNAMQRSPPECFSLP